MSFYLNNHSRRDHQLQLSATFHNTHNQPIKNQKLQQKEPKKIKNCSKIAERESNREGEKEPRTKGTPQKKNQKLRKKELTKREREESWGKVYTLFSNLQKTPNQQIKPPTKTSESKNPNQIYSINKTPPPKYHNQKIRSGLHREREGEREWDTQINCLV